MSPSIDEIINDETAAAAPPDDFDMLCEFCFGSGDGANDAAAVVDDDADDDPFPLLRADNSFGLLDADATLALASEGAAPASAAIVDGGENKENDDGHRRQLGSVSAAKSPPKDAPGLGREQQQLPPLQRQKRPSLELPMPSPVRPQSSSSLPPLHVHKQRTFLEPVGSAQQAGRGLSEARQQPTNAAKNHCGIPQTPATLLPSKQPPPRHGRSPRSATRSFVRSMKRSEATRAYILHLAASMQETGQLPTTGEGQSSVGRPFQTLQQQQQQQQPTTPTTIEGRDTPALQPAAPSTIPSPAPSPADAAVRRPSIGPLKKRKVVHATNLGGGDMPPLSVQVPELLPPPTDCTPTKITAKLRTRLRRLEVHRLLSQLPPHQPQQLQPPAPPSRHGSQTIPVPVELQTRLTALRLQYVSEGAAGFLTGTRTTLTAGLESSRARLLAYMAEIEGGV